MSKDAAMDKFEKVSSPDTTGANALKEIPQKSNDDWSKAKGDSMSKCGGLLKPFGDVELYDSGKPSGKEKPMFKDDKENVVQGKPESFDGEGKEGFSGKEDYAEQSDKEEDLAVQAKKEAFAEQGGKGDYAEQGAKGDYAEQGKKGFDDDDAATQKEAEIIKGKMNLEKGVDDAA